MPTVVGAINVESLARAIDLIGVVCKAKIISASSMKEVLNAVGKELKGAKVAVLRLAMKNFSNDDRISPAVDISKLLIKRGAIVILHLTPW